MLYIRFNMYFRFLEPFLSNIFIILLFSGHFKPILNNFNVTGEGTDTTAGIG